MNQPHRKTHFNTNLANFKWMDLDHSLALDRGLIIEVWIDLDPLLAFERTELDHSGLEAALDHLPAAAEKKE